MTGHASEARHLLLPRFHQAFQSTIFGFNLLEIFCLSEAVNMQQIDMIGLQALQAALEPAQEFIPGSIRNLGSEPDILAPSGHDFSDASFTLPITVRVRRV